MASQLTERLKSRLRPLLFRVAYPRRPRFLCPVCNYRGPFKDKPSNFVESRVRVHEKCLGCGASVRHRLMSLVFDEILGRRQQSQSALHVAPEPCLQQRLRSTFGTYHTMDLYRKDVDFREDLQKLSFADGSYDCIVSARVLHLPDDFTGCLREMNRVLRPGGRLIISENIVQATTDEYHDPELGRRVRRIGLDAFQLYQEIFSQVDLYWSDRYDPRHQVMNVMTLNGRALDDYPEQLRVPNTGYRDVVAVCHRRAA